MSSIHAATATRATSKAKTAGSRDENKGRRGKKRKALAADHLHTGSFARNLPYFCLPSQHLVERRDVLPCHASANASLATLPFFFSLQIPKAWPSPDE